MSCSRKRFLRRGRARGAAVMPRYPAAAAEFSYKVGLDVPASHSAALRLQEASEKILRETSGRFELKVFPDSVLGGGDRMIGQVRLGSLEFLLAGSNVLQAVVPVAGISSIPFAFSDNKDAWNAMDGRLGDYVRRAIAKLNVYSLKEWDYGFKQIANRLRPIAEPADMKGMKLRVPIAPMSIAFFKTLGASPISISTGDYYVSIQTRLVDGSETSLLAIQTVKLYELLKYVSVTNHSWDGVTMVANSDAWQRLPKGMRDVVARNLNAACDLERADVLHLEQSLTAQLKGEGMLFNQADIPAFRSVMSSTGFYSQWRESYGPEAWSLLERSVGKLT